MSRNTTFVNSLDFRGIDTNIDVFAFPIFPELGAHASGTIWSYIRSLIGNCSVIGLSDSQKTQRLNRAIHLREEALQRFGKAPAYFKGVFSDGNHSTFAIYVYVSDIPAEIEWKVRGRYGQLYWTKLVLQSIEPTTEYDKTEQFGDRSKGNMLQY